MIKSYVTGECPCYWTLNAWFLSLNVIEINTELSTRSCNLLKRACAQGSQLEKRSRAPQGVLVDGLYRGLGVRLGLQNEHEVSCPMIICR